MTLFDPRTWVKEVVTSTLFNAELKDHLNLLKDPPTDVIENTATSNFTRTGATTYADVSTTKFQATVTPSVPASRDCALLVVARFTLRPSDTSALNAVTFDLDQDGASVSEGDGLACVEGDNTVALPVSFMHIIEGVPGGVATVIKLRWKINTSARTATIYSNTGTYQQRSQFWVREIS